MSNLRTRALIGVLASVWTATASAQTAKITAIEVNQSVQNLKSDIPIIAGRPAVVRVYLTTSEPAPISEVSGQLLIESADITVPHRVDALTPVGVLPEDEFVKQKPRIRQDLTHTLTFPLPAAMLRGQSLTLGVELMRDNTPVACSNCTKFLEVPLITVPDLRIKLVGLRYRDPETKRMMEPRPIDWALIQSWLTRAFPVSRIEFISEVQDFRESGMPTCDSAISQLFSIRTADVGGNVSPWTHYYGVVYADSPSTFMRGCAHDYGGNPGAMGVGPTGPPSKFPDTPEWEFLTWDKDDSFGDWYAGHEIAHTLGRKHSGCNNAPEDPAFIQGSTDYRFPDTFLASDQSDEAGLDADHATNRFSVLPGRDWVDVMGYCQRVWVSPWTYNGLLQRMREEGVLAGNVNGPGTISTGPAPGATPPAMGPAAPAPAPEAPAGDQATAAAKRADPIATGQGPLFTIIGRVNTETNKGKIDELVPVQRTFSKAFGEIPPGSAAVSVKLEYREAKPVEYGCDVRRLTTEQNQSYDLNATVSCTFPQRTDMTRASLQVNGVAVDSRGAVAATPDVEKITPPPAAGPGAVGPAQPMKFTWSAKKTSDTQSFIVQLSGDEGKTWETVGIGLKSPEILIPVERTKGLNRIQLKVFAVDGLRFDELQTTAVVVPIANR